MQRLSDAEIFSGWVVDALADTLHVRVRGSAVPRPGDEVYVELNSPTVKAAAHLTVLAVTDCVVALRIVRGVTVEARLEEPRFLREGAACRLCCKGHQIQARIVDTSEQGLGLIADASLDVGAAIEMHLTTAKNKMVLGGDVRYCHADPDAEGKFRVGVQLQYMSGHERELWSQFAVG